MQPYDYVDPLINTAKPKPRWVFFQSASRPFGMVQLSPDTDTDGTWGVGYRYNSPRIKCFSHIHSWQLSGIPVLPFAGKWSDEIKEGYTYSHDTEIAKPGYHKIELDNGNIIAELTASKRVGMHKYTFLDGVMPSIYIDLKKPLGPSEMGGMRVNRISEYRLSGYVINSPTMRRHKLCTIYFCIDFNQNIYETMIGEDDSLTLSFNRSKKPLSKQQCVL